MKKLIYLFVFFCIAKQTLGQSALITTDNISVPKVSNLANISTPQAGMLVYNTTDNSMYYRNNLMWVNLNSAVSASNSGTIYYTMTGVPAGISTGIHAGQSPAYAFENNLPTNTISQAFTFTKNMDAGSIKFREYAVTSIPANVIFEALFYNSADVLYFSIKLQTIGSISTKTIAPACENCVKIAETVNFNYSKIGYKDWLNNFSGTYNSQTSVWTSNVY